MIDAVDPLTRGTVTATLSAYPGAPELVLRKLASLPLASRRGDAEGDDLIELFFDANTDERRLILTNLDVTADAAALRPMPAASELIRRLERAARERNSGEFARVLERALGVSRELATRITRDPFGEPLVVAGKALGMSADMLQRILLCLNPVIGQSVERVFELVGFIRRPQRGGRAPHAHDLARDSRAAACGDEGSPNCGICWNGSPTHPLIPAEAGIQRQHTAESGVAPGSPLSRG